MSVDSRPAFILIDHSIAGEGGHYLEYARHVLSAAERVGHRPVLVTNRAFRGATELGFDVHMIYERDVWGRRLARPTRVRRAPKVISWLRSRMFRYSVRLRYSSLGLLLLIARTPEQLLRRFPDARDVLGLGLFLFPLLYGRAILRALRGLLVAVLRPIATGYLGGVLRAVLSLGQSFLYPATMAWRHRSTLAEVYGHQRRVQAFARDTRRVLRRLHPGPDDLVFIPTLSESDFVGLARCFRDEPLSQAPAWHVLFRRDIYSGREPSYGIDRDQIAQIRRGLLRQTLLDVMIKFARHRVHFYTDTSRLTDQYNRLNTFEFATIPIPVNRSFRPVARPTQTQPLLVSYLGDARSEKGYHLLPQIVDTMLPELQRGVLRFAIQSNFAFLDPAVDSAAVVARSQLRRYPAQLVELHETPLDSNAYACLLMSSDVVLIPYDAERYYARSSGILVEALSAGIPVIVPAASWMSDVLQPETTSYHEQVLSRVPPLRTLGRITWRSMSGHEVESRGDELVFGGGTAGISCRFRARPSERYLVVRLRLTARPLTGTYVRVWVRFSDRTGASTTVDDRVIALSGVTSATAMFCRPPAAERIELILSNAFDPGVIALPSVEIHLLITAPQDSRPSVARTSMPPRYPKLCAKSLLPMLTTVTAASNTRSAG
jgi:glycosyltransferase involved in cell wall biosynthesis